MAANHSAAVCYVRTRSFIVSPVRARASSYHTLPPINYLRASVRNTFRNARNSFCFFCADLRLNYPAFSARGYAAGWVVWWCAGSRKRWMNWWITECSFGRLHHRCRYSTRTRTRTRTQPLRLKLSDALVSALIFLKRTEMSRMYKALHGLAPQLQTSVSLCLWSVAEADCDRPRGVTSSSSQHQQTLGDRSDNWQVNGWSTGGAPSLGHGVNWPLKFEIVVKKSIPRFNQIKSNQCWVINWTN